MRLVDVVAARGSTGVTLRTGVVSAYTAPTCTVLLSGATLVGIPKLASYTAPAVNDVVLLIQSDAQLVIIGKVG